jgi:hypothetical protein
MLNVHEAERDEESANVWSGVYSVARWRVPGERRDGRRISIEPGERGARAHPWNEDVPARVLPPLFNEQAYLFRSYAEIIRKRGFDCIVCSEGDDICSEE